MEKVIIFGKGIIHEVVLFYLHRDEKYEVAGFRADIEYIKADIYLGFSMVPFGEVERLLKPAISIYHSSEDMFLCWRLLKNYVRIICFILGNMQRERWGNLFVMRFQRKYKLRN